MSRRSVEKKENIAFRNKHIHKHLCIFEMRLDGLIAACRAKRFYSNRSNSKISKWNAAKNITAARSSMHEFLTFLNVYFVLLMFLHFPPIAFTRHVRIFISCCSLFTHWLIFFCFTCFGEVKVCNENTPKITISLFSHCDL